MRYRSAFAARSRPASEADPDWPAFTDAEPNVLALRPESSALRGDFAADHPCAFRDSR